MNRGIWMARDLILDSHDSRMGMCLQRNNMLIGVRVTHIGSRNLTPFSDLSRLGKNSVWFLHTCIEMWFCYCFLQAEDLSSTGHHYPQRFIKAPTSSTSQAFAAADTSASFITFQWTRYQLPDPELTRRSEDSLLSLRLAPVYYVHTQSFLCRVMNALDAFLNYQDLMNRVRAGAEGFKVSSVLGVS